ncbi:MAG: type IX secretion system membrane protein PorP/SprF [Bacteroidetes bacterium]|nr:type IX secretion system membrane protein PorP/SprF [Bacteroidota bacterium]
MKKYFLHITLFLLLSNAVPFFGQQQSLFTSIITNQYLYNPAYAGVNTGQEYTGLYRSQWAGFSGAPNTALFSGFGTLKKKPQMALGGYIMTERIGLLQRNSLYFSYSYHLRLSNKLNLSFGLSGGGTQYNVRVYDAIPYSTDGTDEFLSNNNLSGNTFDANAGTYLYSKKFFLGISTMQLLSSKITWYSKLGQPTIHMYGIIGYNFELDKKKEWTLQPSMLIRYSNPAPYQWEGNLKLSYKNLVWVGGTYRHKASSSALIGFTIKKQFSVAYAYDYSLNALQTYSSGSHEIMLRYNVSAKKRMSKAEKQLDADEQELNTIDNSLKSNLKNKKNDENK